MHKEIPDFGFLFAIITSRSVYFLSVKSIILHYVTAYNTKAEVFAVCTCLANVHITEHCEHACVHVTGDC